MIDKELCKVLNLDKTEVELVDIIDQLDNKINKLTYVDTDQVIINAYVEARNIFQKTLENVRNRNTLNV